MKHVASLPSSGLRPLAYIAQQYAFVFIFARSIRSIMRHKSLTGALGTYLWLWCGLTYALLLPRDAIPLTVPISGNLANTSTHFEATTWTLYNPVFNQTTWEAQPYVPPPLHRDVWQRANL